MKKAELKASGREEKDKKIFTVGQDNDGKDDTDFSNYRSRGYGGWANLYVF